MEVNPALDSFKSWRMPARGVFLKNLMASSFFMIDLLGNICDSTSIRIKNIPTEFIFHRVCEKYLHDWFSDRIFWDVSRWKLHSMQWLEWIVNSGGDADRWYIGPSKPTNTQIPLTSQPSGTIKQLSTGSTRAEYWLETRRLNIKEAIFCRSCPSIILSGAFGQTKHPINF